MLINKLAENPAPTLLLLIKKKGLITTNNLQQFLFKEKQKEYCGVSITKEDDSSISVYLKKYFQGNTLYTDVFTRNNMSYSLHVLLASSSWHTLWWCSLPTTQPHWALKLSRGGL